ncbi:hypothetical protein DPMN_020147 [Dreissena polymorpha]|uniref:Uncharacterized protein n=1 Tax=Dreissena polymorpha TaxID=45954 RepID=A0A9D4S9Y3_DREPO|nr:hypothetical protein DPMN_020147 [Dreissena polymorpha]
MLKLAQTDRPTDQQTDQQTGQKQYVPHYYSWGHKNQKNPQPQWGLSLEPPGSKSDRHYRVAIKAIYSNFSKALNCLSVEVTVQQKWNSSQTLDTILAHSSKIELKPNTGPVLTSLLLTKIELKPDTGHLEVKDSAEIPFKPDTGPELTSLLFGWK